MKSIFLQNSEEILKRVIIDESFFSKITDKIKEKLKSIQVIPVKSRLKNVYQNAVKGCKTEEDVDKRVSSKFKGLGMPWQVGFQCINDHFYFKTEEGKKLFEEIIVDKNERKLIKYLLNNALPSFIKHNYPKDWVKVENYLDSLY
jgi:hypothetical protein